MPKKERSLDSIKRSAIGLIDSRHTDNDGLLLQRDRKVTMVDLFGSEQKAAVAHYVSDLLAKGFNNQQIIETVKIKFGLEWKMRHVNVVKELLHKMWRCDIAHTMNDQVAREIATIDVQIKEAWEAWEFSKKGLSRKKTRSEKKVGDKSLEGTYDLTEIVTEEDTTAGEVKFLQHINELGKERRKLLGLYAPDKKNDTPKTNAIQLNIVGQGAGSEAATIMGAILGQGAPQQTVQEAEVVEEQPKETENRQGVDMDAFWNDFMED